VIVSTPQDLALMDATRALNLFDAAKVPVIGLVENMAGYVCPHCGNVSDPFGSGGVEQAAAEMGLPFLGRVPLDLSIRVDAMRASRPPPAKARRPSLSRIAARGGRLAEGAPDHAHHARQVLIGAAACGGCWWRGRCCRRLSAAHRRGRARRRLTHGSARGA
jgi:hypothetical protein